MPRGLTPPPSSAEIGRIPRRDRFTSGSRSVRGAGLTPTGRCCAPESAIETTDFRGGRGGRQAFARLSGPILVRKYRSWRKGGGLAGCAGARVERAGTRTYLSNVNVPFSHPSEDKPQKDGRKVRSRDELPLTLGARSAHPAACRNQSFRACPRRGCQIVQDHRSAALKASGRGTWR